MHSPLYKKMRMDKIICERGEPMITLTLDLKTSAGRIYKLGEGQTSEVYMVFCLTISIGWSSS